MIGERSARELPRGLVLFWALWLTIVCLTNLLDGLKALGVVGEGWRLASGNWGLMLQTVGIYGLPAPVTALPFAGVILWEGSAALLFWRVVGRVPLAGPGDREARRLAFAWSLALWAAFMLVDEIVLQYGIEATHMRIFIAQLATLLAIHLVPDGVSTS